MVLCVRGECLIQNGVNMHTRRECRLYGCFSKFSYPIGNYYVKLIHLKCDENVYFRQNFHQKSYQRPLLTV